MLNSKEPFTAGGLHANKKAAPTGLLQNKLRGGPHL